MSMCYFYNRVMPRSLQAHRDCDNEHEEDISEVDTSDTSVIDRTYVPGPISESSTLSCSTSMSDTPDTPSTKQKSAKSDGTRKKAWTPHEIESLFEAAIPFRVILRNQHITMENKDKSQALDMVYGKLFIFNSIIV